MWNDAQRLVKDVPREEVILNENGDTGDIVKGIMEVCNDDRLKTQVADFARRYKARGAEEQYRQLKELWRWVRNNIKYKPDKEAWVILTDGQKIRTDVQDIKEPRRVILDGYADCKSMTTLVYFTCRALGIPCFIRLAAYRWLEDGKQNRHKDLQHVYPVAILDGRAVPVDAVLNRFDAEENALRVEDHYPAVWDSPELRRMAKESREDAIRGGVGDIPLPRWALYLTGGLLTLQLIRSKDLVTAGLAGLGIYTIVNSLMLSQHANTPIR